VVHLKVLCIAGFLTYFSFCWGQQPNEEQQPEIAAAGSAETKEIGSSKDLDEKESGTGSNSNFLIILIIVLSFCSGALLVWSIMLRRQRGRLEALKESVLNGGEKIPLLNEEALELIVTFKKELEDSRSELFKEFKEHQTGMKLQLKEAKEIASEAQALTSQTVTDVAENLQKSFGKIQTYMQKIADSSAGAHEQTKETAEYAKQVGETVIEKDLEITKLRKGYQLSMIGPVIKGVLELRDKLTALEGLSDIDEATQKELNELNQLVVSSLKDVGVNEMNIQHGTDPSELALHKWDALEASLPTSKEDLSKKVAEVVTPGYVALGPESSDIVVRKAKVIRYKYSGSEGEDN
jgi:hypothetical protein